MCLQIDGQAYCEVLYSAPRYQGKSLERVEHDLEENKQQYTPEVEALLARTCGLTVEVYRDRVVRIRSENLLRQVEYYGDLATDYGPYFVLPPTFEEYAEGRTHEMPSMPFGVTLESWVLFTEALIERRFKKLLERIDKGMSTEDLRAYPEQATWIPRAANALSARRTSFYLRALKASDIPPRSLFYIEAQLKRKLSDWNTWFTNQKLVYPAAVIWEQLTPGERESLKRYVEWRISHGKRKPKQKKGQPSVSKERREWRQEMQASRRRFQVWKMGLRSRIAYEIEVSYGLVPSLAVAA